MFVHLNDGNDFCCLAYNWFNQTLPKTSLAVLSSHNYVIIAMGLALVVH